MKKSLLAILAGVFLFISCNNDDVNIFDKDASTRAAEAIDSLKAKLVAPANGWLVRYRPETESGYYNVILDFDEDNNVNIKSDLGANDNEFFDQTVTYRIDNSLGLELIFENYSFFSYLFEQDNAEFGAEFEFNYVNETEDGDLVFNSKSDLAQPTIIAFQQASSSDIDLLGTAVTANVSKMTEGVPTITSVMKITYPGKDVSIYLNLNDFRRTLQFNYISRSSTNQNGQKIDFSTGYTFIGNSLVLDRPLTGSFSGNSINVSSIEFDDFSSSEVILCNDTIPTYQYTGELSTGESVVLETSLFDPEGALIDESFTFYYAVTQNIFNSEGFSAQNEVEDDIIGAIYMQIYFRDPEDDPGTSMGFLIQNPNSGYTFALKKFSYTLTGNSIQMDFEDDYTLYNDTTATIDAEAMDKYLDLFTEGGNTYIYRYSDEIYEFYNPCNGWGFYFFTDDE